jgi:hypothetical protein
LKEEIHQGELFIKLFSLACAWACFGFCRYGIFLEAPNLVVSITGNHVEWKVFLWSLCALPACLLAFPLMKWFGPRKLQIIGFIATLAAVFSFSHIQKKDVSQSMWMADFCAVAFALHLGSFFNSKN